MQVSIQLLNDHEAVRAALQRDGWHLQAAGELNRMRAKHPQVHEERDARWRLNELGLLTCRTCRIEFQR